MTTSDPSTDDNVDYEPRARIVEAASGRVTRVRKDTIIGLDEWADSWQNDVEVPDVLGFQGWQMSDDAHPAGTGLPAYRLVHKMIRTVPFPQVAMTYPNARVSLANGPVTLGEPRFEGALPARQLGAFMLPEWGELKQSGGQWGYEHTPNMLASIQAHQETTPPGNYLEILYQLPPGDWTEFDQMLASGRAGVSAITCMIDLLHGERVLGPVLTEEVGEVFEDWHWNRLLGGRTLSLEGQAEIRHVDGRVFAETLGAAIESHIEKPDDIRNRIRIAAQWYWRAAAEPEDVQRYIAYWLCIEALELGQNANITPVKRAIAQILGVEQDLVGGPVGRMYGTRSGLVHGSIRTVSREATANVEHLAVALLERRVLGKSSEGRVNALRAALGLVEAGPDGGAPETRA